MISENKKERMLKQQYGLIGNHSAVKVCLWCKKALKNEGVCYKEHFYGINTLNCLEMSPALVCNQRCVHCWRDTSLFAREWEGKVDDPKFIIEEAVKARWNLINGFRAHKKVTDKMYEKAKKVDHAAISLTGEPCMYPRINELIDEFFNQKFKSVFLVTSGTVPDALKKLNKKPTNLYLSIEATNKEQYNEICKPVIEDAWKKILESMDILREIKKTRTILRITCIKGINMNKPEEFVPLINRMKPNIIEAKGYAFMGYSKYRLEKKNAPSFEEVKEFVEKLNEKLEDYKIWKSLEGPVIATLKKE